jgi:AraC family transcriptional regulator, arabinose operon regulatory protein
MYVHYIALDSTHGSDFVVDKPTGRIDILLLYIKTPSTLVINNQIYSIINPACILINSNTPHRYSPTGNSYVDDYLHFAVDNQEDFLSELTFPLNTPIEILNDSYIHEIMSLLLKEFNQDNKNSGRIFSLLIDLLMIKIGDEWNLYQNLIISNPHFHDLLKVRNQILNFPEKNWKIDELADQAHLSHAYFQVMYKKAFGITCITDVINAKIAKAKLLLNSTDLPVKQVAQELGYNEVYHFIRQFKKSTGQTPGAFRKK